ncbi:MAG: PilZ domain-containing protein [Planctomycetota bacterium]
MPADALTSDPMPTHGPPLREGDRREIGRLEVRQLRTKLGRVVDISPGGLRVRGLPWPAVATYDEFEIELHGLQEVVPVTVRLVWIARPGMLTREIGLSFEHLNPHAEHALSGLFAACRQVHGRAA